MTLALEEFIARRRQRGLLELMGKLEWDPGCDYKQERQRGAAPVRTDHIDAAELRIHCRLSGVQVGTIDALIAQLCIRHDLILLSTDADFRHAARFCPLRNWGAT